jgi:hypothetical protein
MNETTTAPEPLYLQAANPYASPQNIEFGHARILWGQQKFGGPGGWFLPGGFTSNKFEAMDCAIAIDRLIRENGRR